MNNDTIVYAEIHITTDSFDKTPLEDLDNIIEASGNPFFVNDAFVEDKSSLWNRYVSYLCAWALEHFDIENEGCNPLTYDQYAEIMHEADFNEEADDDDNDEEDN